MAEDRILRVRDFPREVMEHEPAETPGQRPAARTIWPRSNGPRWWKCCAAKPGNKTRAARTLGIDRRKLYRLVEKYDIQETELVKTTASVTAGRSRRTAERRAAACRTTADGYRQRPTQPRREIR